MNYLRILAAWGLISLLTNYAAATHTGKIKLPSGREVPTRAVHDVLKIKEPTSLETLVFEADRNLQIRGHNSYSPHLNLTALTSSSRKVPWRQQLTVTLNGKFISVPKMDVFWRTGDSLSVLHTAQGDILGVWGNGLKLIPLDHAAHAGVLVNRAQMTSEESKFRDNEDEDLFPPGMVGYTSSDHRRQNKVKRKSCLEKTPRRIVEVASAFDNALCRLYGNDVKSAVAVVRGTIYSAEEAYRKQTCLLLNPVHIEAHCDDPKDPYRNFDSLADNIARLKRFRRIWRKRRTTIHRDIGYFFPGEDDGTGIAGVAWIAATCSKRFGYGLVEYVDPFVTAHEIGHNLNCPHDNSGIMQATIPSDKTMVFSDTSVSQMVDFIDNFKNASCIRKGKRPPPPPTPSNTPSPSPRDDIGMCSYGFSRLENFGMECNEGFPSFVYTDAGTVYVQARQQYERFDVEVSAPEGFSFEVLGTTYETSYKVKKADVLVSSEDTVSDSSPLWDRNSFTEGVPKHDVKWPASKVKQPAGVDSCCSISLYIHVRVSLEKREEVRSSDGTTADVTTGSASDTLTTFVWCRFSCFGRFVPMTPSRKCESCED